MNGKRAITLLRGVAALALAVSLAVAGACGASTTAAKDKSPASSTKATSTAEASGSGSRGGMPRGSEPVKLDPADFSGRHRQPLLADGPGKRVGLQRDGHQGHEPEGRRRGHRRYEDDSQRDRGPRDARHGHRERRAGRDHRRLVRPGPGREHLVPRRVRHQLQERQGHRPRWFVRGGRRRRAAGDRHAGQPDPGLSYRQEYYKDEAEDKGAVITVGDERVQVPFGYFDKNILMTRDLVPTEPKVQELKFYAPNVGPLLSVHTDGDGSRAELVSYSRNGWPAIGVITRRIVGLSALSPWLPLPPGP